MKKRERGVKDEANAEGLLEQVETREVSMTDLERGQLDRKTKSSILAMLSFR